MGKILSIRDTFTRPFSVFYLFIFFRTGVSLVAQMVRVCLQCRRPGLGRFPWRKERPPTAIFWPGESHGLYSPWGRKASDTSERLSLSSSYLKGEENKAGGVSETCSRESMGVARLMVRSRSCFAPFGT